MDPLIPWERLEQRIAPHYPKGSVGRRPYPLGAMLRVHCLQLFYDLSDPAMEDALYEVKSMRRFARVGLDRVPDETTILNFRHLLERYALGPGAARRDEGAPLAAGVGDARGNDPGCDDPLGAELDEEREGRARPGDAQTRKGNQWHLGMKLHVGVDDVHRLIHSVHTTAANEADINVAGELLHGDEHRSWGNAGYQGIEQREEHPERRVAWWIAMRPKRKALGRRSAKARLERFRAQMRAKVEHPFHYVKQVFGHAKVRYRGLAKNTNRLLVLSGFTNLLIARRYIDRVRERSVRRSGADRSRAR